MCLPVQALPARQEVQFQGRSVGNLLSYGKILEVGWLERFRKIDNSTLKWTKWEGKTRFFWDIVDLRFNKAIMNTVSGN